MTLTVRPFADDGASIAIGKLTIENSADCLSLYGSLDITRDRRGLEVAQQLQTVLTQAIETLQDQKDLPDAVPRQGHRTVPNPFG